MNYGIIFCMSTNCHCGLGSRKVSVVMPRVVSQGGWVWARLACGSGKQARASAVLTACVGPEPRWYVPDL